MRRRTNRFPYPLPNPMPVRDGNGKYPERMKILFSDGHSRMYREEVIQPQPVLIGEREFNRLFRENGGYRAKKEEPEESENRKTINRLRKILIMREKEIDEKNAAIIELAKSICFRCVFWENPKCGKCEQCFVNAERKKAK